MRTLHAYTTSPTWAPQVEFIVEGARLPVHSQFLARFCTFFSDMFAAEGLEGLPSREAPLHVEEPLRGSSLAHVLLFLNCIYRPENMDQSVSSPEFSTPEALAGVRSGGLGKRAGRVGGTWGGIECQAKPSQVGQGRVGWVGQRSGERAPSCSTTLKAHLRGRPPAPLAGL